MHVALPPDSNRSDITVITTHINADFDALASLLAAQKLYPEALIVFPGSQEKNLRNFFISSMAYLFNMREIGAVDLGRTTTTPRRKTTSGAASSAAPRPGRTSPC